VDTQTRHSLKQNSFAQVTANSVSWLSGHRSSVLRWVIVSIAALAVVVAGLGFTACSSGICAQCRRRQRAGSGSGCLQRAAGPAGSSGPCNGSLRFSQRGSRQGRQSASLPPWPSKYGWLAQRAPKPTTLPASPTRILANNGPAETELKAAAGSWDRNLANLAKLASGRTLSPDQPRQRRRLTLYTALDRQALGYGLQAAVAQLDLADLYAATGKQSQSQARCGPR
jgi:hypothetical protein